MMTTIQVKTSSVRFPAAPNLYGLFFEDINRSGDGGLYPEMLRNRSFEDSILPKRCTFLPNGLDFITPNGWKDQFNNGEGLRRWSPDLKPTPVPGWYAVNASICLDQEDVLNDKREAALHVHFYADSCIYNDGYKGIPCEAGTALNGYMFLKSASGVSSTLTLSLRSADLSKVYARAEVTISADGNIDKNANENSADNAADSTDYKADRNAGYIKYDFTFTPDATDWNGVFVIESAQPADILIGYTSLRPADTYLGHGLRKDLMEMLRDTSSTFFRFPGGCIVEGFTKETSMRFPGTIGPEWERPSHQLMWHYRTSNGLGFHEYLQLCEDLNLEPLYVINCGLTCQGRREELFEGEELEEWLQQACDAIDYAIAPQDTPMGQLRAAAGHPAPFKMTYIEIGNENLGEDYLVRYRKFYDALKARYPQLKYIANIHVEKEGLSCDLADEHYYNTPEFFARQYHMFDDYDRKGPQIFIGEYAVTSGDDVGNLRSAIAESMYLLGIENNQDIVAMTAYAPLFNHVHYTSWAPDLIAFDNHQAYGIPFYHALCMLAANRGKDVVETSYDAPAAYEQTIGLTGLITNGPGVKVRNLSVNGAPVSPSHNIVSSLKEADGTYETWETDNTELMKTPGLSVKEVLSQIKTYVTFGDEEVEKTVYETDLYLTDPSVKASLAFWIHNNTMLHNQDETLAGKSKLWTPVYTNRYTLSLENGEAYVDAINRGRYTWRGPHKQIASLRCGEWMKVRVEAEHECIRFFIDGQLVMEQPVVSFPTIASSASTEENTIYLKIANISNAPEQVEISLDCDVQDTYELTVLTGDSPKAENTFENPRAVSPCTTQAAGASRTFPYSAPACSLSILKLTK